MALVRSPVYTLNITLQDRDRNKSTLSFYVDTVNTIAEIQTAITSYFIPRIVAITNALVTGWSIVTSAEDSDVTAVAPEVSDVERKGVFSFRAANSASYVLSVPSIQNTMVVDGTNKIDIANAAVVDFVELVTSPTLLALVRPRTYLGSDITRLDKAEKHHRGSRNG
jgi:hypothetical protein